MAIEDFKGIVESLKLAIAIADAKGHIVFGNAALGQLVGAEVKSLLGAPLAELFAAGDQKRVQQNAARVAQNKSGVSFLDAQLAGDRDPAVWLQVALQPALDAKGKPAGVIAVLQDIGAHRDTEEALNLVTARLLALAEALPVGTMIETGPGDIELVNVAFLQWLAIDSAPQSLSGLPAHEVLARSPHVDPTALERIRRKPEERLRIPVKRAGGEEVTLERHPLVVEGEHGGAVWAPRGEGGPGGGGKAAAEIALIERIGEELSVALEGISAISIRAHQMDMDGSMISHVQNMRSSLETAMAAIGDLIDFSRVSGSVVLHKSPFGLRAALAELVSRLVPSAEEHDCRLRIKVEQDVSDPLEGDVARLQLVLRNLIENAFALLPGAEIMLQITPEYTTENGLQLSFSVIAQGDTVANASADASTHTGMGVTMAKFMVAAMGGELAIAERPRNGPLYSFSIEFPVTQAPPAPRRPTYVSLVGLTVLVVSADPEQRLKLSSLLRGWRMVPLEADNAPMALALLERLDQEGNPAPLVVLSNKLPVQDGFLLAFRIKHHPRLKSTLVMMLAAEGKPGDAIACRENGIAAYMRYPVNDQQLNQAIVAVTGASVDADETPTLVTRHSLREQRKGATILLVDPSRDSQILAAHVLGRQDCSIVVANDLTEATAALDQDVYDIVLVDTSLAGLAGEDAARVLRGRISRNAEAVALVATSLDHSPAFREAKTAIGFDATLAKPFRKDDLLALLQSLGRLAVEAE